MTAPQAAPTPEFSRPVSLARLEAREALHEITATEAERAALARRFDLVALDRLTAEVRLSRGTAGVRLAATLVADIVQLCSVTLEPFPSQVEDSFALVYRKEEAPQDELVDPAGEDYEILTGDEIDIGEAVAQQLSLVLDPFPRAPDVELADAAPEIADPPAEAPADSPFAVLARLAKK